jgi:hypothetical protein
VASFVMDTMCVVSCGHAEPNRFKKKRIDNDNNEET